MRTCSESIQARWDFNTQASSASASRSITSGSASRNTANAASGSGGLITILQSLVVGDTGGEVGDARYHPCTPDANICSKESLRPLRADGNHVTTFGYV